MWAVCSFRHCQHTTFTLITDHQPLKWLLTIPNGGSPDAHGVVVQEFDFEVQYQPGIEDVTTDALSRVPPPLIL